MIDTARKLAAAALVAAVLVAAFVAASAAVGACTPDEHRERVTRLPEPDDALSEDLMVALAQAKNFHHKAKVYMGDGNLAEAIASVRQILSIRFPASAAEGEDVRLDARALLAKLLVSKGELAEAQRVVDEGLAAASRPSFFVANLWTVKGEVLEARAAVVDGDAAAVAQARRDAIRAYDESIRINTALQQRLLEERN